MMCYHTIMFHILYMYVLYITIYNTHNIHIMYNICIYVNKLLFDCSELGWSWKN